MQDLLGRFGLFLDPTHLPPLKWFACHQLYKAAIHQTSSSRIRLNDNIVSDDKPVGDGAGLHS